MAASVVSTPAFAITALDMSHPHSRRRPSDGSIAILTHQPDGTWFMSKVGDQRLASMGCWAAAVCLIQL